MKKLIIAFIAIFTVSAFTANAQNVTFAHVSSAEVLDSIQSYKDLVKEETQINREANKQFEVLQRQIYKMQEDAQAKLDSLTDFEIDMISTDIQKKQMDMQNLEVYTQNQLGVLQERLVKLMDMYRDAVAVVAKKYNITYVLDADSQVLYAGPAGNDITEEVRTEMLRMDAANPVHRL